jgi:hypothetical protein
MASHHDEDTMPEETQGYKLSQPKQSLAEYQQMGTSIHKVQSSNPQSIHDRCVAHGSLLRKVYIPRQHLILHHNKKASALMTCRWCQPSLPRALRWRYESLCLPMSSQTQDIEELLPPKEHTRTHMSWIDSAMTTNDSPFTHAHRFK